MRKGSKRNTVVFVAALLGVALFSARAEDPDLEVSETPPETPSEFVEPPSSVPVFEDGAEPLEGPPLSAGAKTEKKPSAPARFNLQKDQARFQRWLHQLCGLEAVGVAEALRLRSEGTKTEKLSAKNKQGSLRLLLENYVDDLRLEASCASSSKTACLVGGKKKWEGALDARRLLERAKTPLQALPGLREKREARQKALRAEFFELRDLSELNGKPESAAVASSVIEAMEKSSTCRTRAVHSEVMK
jgi:hypothetical protein